MTHYFYEHRSIFVNDSMIVELTNRMLPDTPEEEYLTCDVVVETSPSRRLLIHFLSLEISSADKDIDRLHIYDFERAGKAVRVTPTEGLYGQFDAYYNGIKTGLKDYLSTTNRFKLDYQGRPTLAYDGFKLLITSVRDARGDCGRGYFRCSKLNVCIPESACCDGLRNCGNADDSDESNCQQHDNDWHKIDGQIAAVIASSTACTLFLLVVAVTVLVIIKLNKRDRMQHNITVEFKKRKTTKRQISNGAMTRLYAPPSYEVVIGMDEQPPPYHSVISPYYSDSDEEDGVLREQPSTSYEVPRARMPDENPPSSNETRSKGGAPKRSKPKSKPIVRIASVVVTCDNSGNQVCSAQACDVTSEYSVDEDVTSKSGDVLQQFGFKVCPVEQPSLVSSKREADTVSSCSDSSKDENRNKHKVSNGNIIAQNGMNPETLDTHKCVNDINGKVSFVKGLSADDGEIVFVDDE